MHPHWLRCSFFKYSPVFSVVAPCHWGASSVSVLAGRFTTGCYRVKIIDLEVLDLRFPTARAAIGTDAMHPDPDYSAAYVILKTDEGLEGHGLTFTIGRGNEVCVAAINAFRDHVVGYRLDDLTSDLGAFWRRLAGDSQLRWLGPEKGVIHISMAAIVNAVWDLYAKAQRKPVWKLLADMTPAEIVRCIDFRYITDALTPDEALELLERQRAGKADREQKLLQMGYPAYTTSAGWIGYSDDRIRAACHDAAAAGFSHFKVKVGASPEDDHKRVGLVREAIGPSRTLMIDANQRWDVAEAIERVKGLAEFDLLWIEEPTSPDDVLGHATIARAVAPVGVATGEHCANRVLFKQLLQAGAISFCQIDSCRLGGVNENLAVILMAAKFGVPVCPHAGGVGLCELVQHLSMFDYIAVTGTMDRRVTEFVDHLHEHFVDPVVIKHARYMPPQKPGYSAEIKSESRQQYRFPEGRAWSA
jgi:L-fuconate dehydratase